MTIRNAATIALTCAVLACSDQRPDDGAVVADAATQQQETASTSAPAAEEGAAMDTFVMPTNLQSTPSGLQYTVDQPGTGAQPQTGQTVSVHYTGWLTDGTKFDSSRDRGAPIEFPIGTGRVIKGWDEGVGAMKVGEKRTLVIPSSLGYGARGAGGAIPPNATLVFKVELVGIE